MSHEYKVKTIGMKGIESLKFICKCNINMIDIAHLNINFLRSKYDSLVEKLCKSRYSHDFGKTV